jgi:STE24 endopeptidase
MHASADQGNSESAAPTAAVELAAEPAAAITVDADDATMTAEQLAEAKRYGAVELACSLADKAIDVAFLSLMAFALARPVAAWLETITWLRHSPSLQLLALGAITVGLHVAVSFPLSFYSSYVLERRFGLSRQSLGRWLIRYSQRTALALGFTLALFVGLYWVIWLSGAAWWLVAAAAFFVISVVFGQLMPVLILPLFYKIERIDNAELNARMARISAGTGLSIEGVYRMGLSAETEKANAALTGLGRTRRVLMGDTLLDRFTPDEIEVIFAHEIGHHVFHHIRKMIVTGAFFSAAGFWVCDRLMMAWVHSFDPTAARSDLPIATLPLLMLVLTVFSLLLEPVQNIISRRYERQCDRYALERTGLKQAYVSAFRKLARINKDDPRPHPLEVFLFHSHPPIAERLAMAKE